MRKYREPAKVCSRIGLALFVMMLSWQVVLSVVIAVIDVARPGFLDDRTWLTYLLNDIVLYGVGVTLFLLIVKGIPEQKEPARQKMKMNVGRFLLLLVFCFGLVYATSFVTNIVLTLLQTLFGIPASGGGGEMGPLASFLLISCVPAFGEEFVFRYMLRRKLRGSGDKVYIFFSALCFGIFHGNFNQMFYAFALGLVYAWIYVRTNCIWYTVALHFINNFVSSVLMPLIPMDTEEEMLRGTVILLASYGVLALCALIIFLATRKKVREGWMPSTEYGWNTKPLKYAPAILLPVEEEPQNTVENVSHSYLQMPDTSPITMAQQSAGMNSPVAEALAITPNEGIEQAELSAMPATDAVSQAFPAEASVTAAPEMAQPDVEEDMQVVAAEEPVNIASEQEVVRTELEPTPAMQQLAYPVQNVASAPPSAVYEAGYSYAQAPSPQQVQAAQQTIPQPPVGQQVPVQPQAYPYAQPTAYTTPQQYAQPGPAMYSGGNMYQSQQPPTPQMHYGQTMHGGYPMQPPYGYGMPSVYYGQQPFYGQSPYYQQGTPYYQQQYGGYSYGYGQPYPYGGTQPYGQGYIPYPRMNYVQGQYNPYMPYGTAGMAPYPYIKQKSATSICLGNVGMILFLTLSGLLSILVFVSPLLA